MARRPRMSVEEIRARGLGWTVIDRPTHPSFHASSWPYPIGLNTLGERAKHRIPHIAFNSVLVTVISNQWCEGGWHRLQDMLKYTEEQGHHVALEEVDDLSLMPTDAIGIMRACAAMLALDSGFEWCLMVDTDVLLEKDTLVRLLAHDIPIVFPFLDIQNDQYPASPISSPHILESNVGLQPMIWSAMSCMLFNTKVFNCLDHYAWHGHDYHFAQSLRHYGHRIHMDTDTVVGVARGPARNASKPWDTLWADMKKAHGARTNIDRDRRPPPGYDPVFGKGTVNKDGTYWALDSWKYSAVRGPMHQDDGDAPS